MNIDFKRLVSRLDLHRLSGVRSVIGIELDSGRARVAELRRQGNPLDTLSGHLAGIRAFHVDFAGESSDECGLALKKSLEEHKVSTAYAVVAPKGVRYLSAVIPPEVENAREWVDEHIASLLHLPVSTSDLLIHLEPGRPSPSGVRVLITLVRKREIEWTNEVARASGLKLLAISPGFQDLIPMVALSVPGSPPARFRIIHTGGGSLTTLSCENGEITGIAVEYRSGPPRLAESKLTEPDIERTGEEQIFVFGAGAGRGGSCITINPFGLGAEFALASALAMKGLLHAERGVDFLPKESRENVDTELSKGLLTRAAFSAGCLLILLLGLPLGLTEWCEMKSAQFDEQLSSVADSSAGIGALESELANLEKSAHFIWSPESHSNISYLLHEVASLTPKDIRLSSLSFKSSDATLTLKGESRSPAGVSAFLTQLKSSPLLTSVALKTLKYERASGETNGSRPGVASFEVLVHIAPGHRA